MAAERPSYMLAPNWDFPPDGPIALGSLIKNPKRPDRALNSSTRVEIDKSRIITTKRTGWSLARGDLRLGRVGLWASFLAPILGVGADIATSASRDSNDVYKCDELETRYFAPEDTYIGSCLCSPATKAYTDSHWWKSIYMITGLKIAYGATMETTKEIGYGTEGKIGADGTPAGVPVGGGPEAKYEQKKKHSVKFGASEGFVIAYQLLRIKPKRNATFKEAEYNKFALLGEGEDVDSLEKQRMVELLHEAWEIEELRQPTNDEEWEDLELLVDGLDVDDCNILATRPRPE